MSTDVSEVRAAYIIITTEAARTSETSVDIQLRTRQYVPEDSELHTRHRDKLKSHKVHLTSYIILGVKYAKREWNSIGLGEGQVTRCCEHGNGHYDSIKGDEFLDYLNDFQLSR
jgi:hypothetical protein